MTTSSGSQKCISDKTQLDLIQIKAEMFKKLDAVLKTSRSRSEMKSWKSSWEYRPQWYCKPTEIRRADNSRESVIYYNGGSCGILKNISHSIIISSVSEAPSDFGFGRIYKEEKFQELNRASKWHDGATIVHFMLIENARRYVERNWRNARYLPLRLLPSLNDINRPYERIMRIKIETLNDTTKMDLLLKNIYDVEKCKNVSSEHGFINEAKRNKETNMEQESCKWILYTEPVQDHDNQYTTYVDFENEELGIAMINSLKQQVEVQTDFGQKVEFTPEYEVVIPITEQMRTVLNNDIILLKQKAKEENNVDIKDYTGKFDQKYILITGWPQSQVDSVVERLQVMMRGERFDCSKTEMFSLLYGKGSFWVDKIRKEHSARVLIDVSLMEKSLILVGSEQERNAVKEILTKYVTEKDNFHIECTIEIAPQYHYYTMQHVFDVIGIETLSLICGSPSLEFNRKTNHIEFSGNGKQYDNLKLLLNELDEMSWKSAGQSCPTCHICLGRIPDASFQLQSCGHLFCLDCIIDQVQSNVEGRQMPIRCCYPECNELVPLEDLERLYMGENPSSPMGFRMKKFFKTALDVEMESSQNLFIFCNTPDCQGMDSIEISLSNEDEIFCCYMCKARMCAECRKEIHIGFTCMEYKNKVDSETAFRRYFDQNTNFNECPTPSCSYKMEKIDGCNHVKCLACKVHFCWKCKYTADTREEIHRHMNEKDHNEIGFNNERVGREVARRNEERFRPHGGREAVNVNRLHMLLPEGRTRREPMIEENSSQDRIDDPYAGFRGYGAAFRLYRVAANPFLDPEGGRRNPPVAVGNDPPPTADRLREIFGTQLPRQRPPIIERFSVPRRNANNN